MAFLSIDGVDAHPDGGFNFGLKERGTKLPSRFDGNGAHPVDSAQAALPQLVGTELLREPVTEDSGGFSSGSDKQGRLETAG